MRKLFLMMSLFVCAFTNAQQIDLKKEIPFDSTILVGKLPNGITYYLRHNTEPKERASFYIIRNAGALLENDDQNGLAHFLEHMAFNGSKNFPGNSMISTLERNGISFGGNLNAYTGQNETVYNISSVPSKNSALVDTCLLVLHDWSYYLTLDQKDIDDERGVISEEWRTRRNSQARINEQQTPTLFKDSKYAVRDVIGSLDIIKNFKPETIRDFYHAWYRTDLEALAIVGDFDVKEMEAKIVKVFSSIPKIENAQQRPFFEIPSHNDTYYALGTDAEATNSRVSLVRYWKKKPSNYTVTYQDVKDGLIESFYNSMIGARIGEKIQRGEASYLGASISVNGYVRGYKSYNLAVVAKPNKEDEALKEVLEDNQRILQYGFTDSELERVKIETETSIKSTLKNLDKISNETFIQSMQTSFLENERIVSLADYCQAVKEILPTITTKEISEKIKDWWKEDNRVILVSGPSKEVKHLTEAEAKAIIAEVENKQVESYQDVNVSGNLISEELPGSPIVKTKELKAFGAKQWTLKNGATVVFRKADFEKDNVALSAYSKGGTSLYDNVDDMLVAENVASFMSSYGLGDYDAIALDRILTGKRAGCYFSIGSLYENVSGSSTPEDVETMLQLLYLRFQHPRFDAQAHKTLMENLGIMIAQAKGNPQKIMQDSLQQIYSNYSPRAISLDENNMNKLTLDNIERIYKDRIKDASDFTFFIVGNVDEETIKPLVEKYIGSIPSSYSKEKWVDRKVRSPKGIVKKVIELPLETPKTTVSLSYGKDMKCSPKGSYLIYFLSAVLDFRFTENIREKEGGTYGVSVSPNTTREPVNAYSLDIQFDCDPDRAEHLKSLVFAEIDNLIKNGVTNEELEKIVKNLNKNSEHAREHNSYWMNVIYNYYRTGIDSNKLKNSDDIVNKMKAKEIQNFAKKFFAKPDLIDISFVPEKK